MCYGFPEVIPMNLKQIGQFISAQRKEHGLTQEELGDRIGVTNKTVSRWETGTYLPPADALMKMSTLFGVSVNELLSGRRLTEAEYQAEAEKNLLQTMTESSFTLKEKIAYFRKKWLQEHIAAMTVWGALILAVLICGVVMSRSILCVLSGILLLVAHGWRNNAMMTYVEQNAFDGSGRQ